MAPHPNIRHTTYKAFRGFTAQLYLYFRLGVRNLLKRQPPVKRGLARYAVTVPLYNNSLPAGGRSSQARSSCESEMLGSHSASNSFKVYRFIEASTLSRRLPKSFQNRRRIADQSCVSDMTPPGCGGRRPPYDLKVLL